MIIDMHCHVWSVPAVDYHAYQHAEVYMRDHDMEYLGLIAMNDRENDEVQKLVEKSPRRYFGIGYLDRRVLPQSVPAFRNKVKAGHFRALKLYPYFEHFDVDDPEMDRVYETCLELDIPILFHLGWIGTDKDISNGSYGKYRFTGFPHQYGTVLEKYPELKVILAHLGGNYYYECMGIVQRFPNVFMDTAWLKYYADRRLPPVDIVDWISHAASIMGTERLLFGGEGTPPDAVRRSTVSDGGKKRILFDNAQALFKLASDVGDRHRAAS